MEDIGKLMPHWAFSNIFRILLNWFFSNRFPVNGKAMIIQLGENEFIGIGTNCRFTFEPIGKKQGKAWQYLKVQEGFYDENGDFKMLRILNGDQTDWGGPQVGDAPSILHFTLTTR